ncbi:YdeI/OmpD-associated family protein [Microbacterium oleivorans]|uniref:YdeI/OmpD-associated family protein n=1 Tax=Microbacterium oleivorans TaxID=273677 RepID=A0A7D5ITV3_9MICO|nr:YdeI/OmpD-associated family protein [Microbacterium oleivorans]QLD12657.1 YdeI/OmpD-associated family protein [Microbacterium oleivorans]
MVDDEGRGPLVLIDTAAWRSWLDENESTSDGVQLVLAKKGVTRPTSLSYAAALDEALCSGWIDGRRNARDGETFLQLFTPRRARSIWSQRNVEIVNRLIGEGRMRDRGRVEIDRARSDGRWDRAYAGQAAAQVPDDLAAALAASPVAAARLAALGSAERYSVLHPILTASSPATRTVRIARAVARLADGG